jgi:hypothetical protein
MGVTPTDLYRIGDATGSGLDRLRAGLFRFLMQPMRIFVDFLRHGVMVET